MIEVEKWRHTLTQFSSSSSSSTANMPCFSSRSTSMGLQTAAIGEIDKLYCAINGRWCHSNGFEWETQEITTIFAKWMKRNRLSISLWSKVWVFHWRSPATNRPSTRKNVQLKFEIPSSDSNEFYEWISTVMRTTCPLRNHLTPIPTTVVYVGSVDGVA